MNEYQPSRELDAIIAVTFFGWKWKPYDPCQGTGRYLEGPKEQSGAQHWDGRDPTYFDGLPKYSTKLMAAWKLVRKICKRDNFDFALKYHECEVTFSEAQRQNDGPAWVEDIEYSANGDSIPHAICIAALKVEGLL